MCLPLLLQVLAWLFFLAAAAGWQAEARARQLLGSNSSIGLFGTCSLPVTVSLLPSVTVSSSNVSQASASSSNSSALYLSANSPYFYFPEPECQLSIPGQVWLLPNTTFSPPPSFGIGDAIDTGFAKGIFNVPAGR